MRLRWSGTAGDHLEDIFEYLLAVGSSRPEQVIAEIVEAAEQLTLHPRMGHSGRCEGTRELTHRPYIIVYEVVADVVNIVSVFHGSRHREP